MYTCSECGWFIKEKMGYSRQEEVIREHFKNAHPQTANSRVAEEITRIRSDDGTKSMTIEKTLD